MAALEASVKAAKAARQRHPSGEPVAKPRTGRAKAAAGGDDTADDESADEVTADNVTALAAKPARSRTRKSA